MHSLDGRVGSIFANLMNDMARRGLRWEGNNGPTALDDMIDTPYYASGDSSPTGLGPTDGTALEEIPGAWVDGNFWNPVTAVPDFVPLHPQLILHIFRQVMCVPANLPILRL
ncbi:hypothetical protein ACRALDRAFT_2015711 [Sodiomyces alcalophilus JCM 7366]|uniref:uncharacterized protein n=1 Tax=Sodiomyces alcalophilus JCM 7366 TaxID=591952 RepID=UPI0039B4E095